jgi:glycosyltransferase involved in cell wall biosynthesis
MVKISGVVITYNEEKNIERCLKSLLLAVEEVIVVDSFSNDSTEDICSKFERVKFFKRRFDGYSSQKNWAFEKISYPIVLSLDADEALSDELLVSINNVKSQWDCQGYYCNRLNNYCGKWIRNGDWYPDKKLRLWDIRRGAWDDAIVHEKVTLDADAVIGHLKGDILHYSYNAICEHITQANKYSELAALQAFNHKKRMSVVKILARPFWNFFHSYLIKRGFRDGFYGFVIATIASFTTFLKYVKLHELHTKQIQIDTKC